MIKMKHVKKTTLLLAVALVLIIGGVFAPVGSQAAGTKAFSDMQKHWAKETVQWAIEKGMVNGYVDGTFKPDRTITEAEFLTMLIRAYIPDAGADEEKVHWADAYYRWGKELNYPVVGLLNAPAKDKPITRVKVAELIAATEGVNFSGDNAIKYVLAFGLSSGTNPNEVSVASFAGSKMLTRAEAVQFLKNSMDQGIGGLLPRPVAPSDPASIPPIRL